MFPNLSNPDSAYLVLVKELIPSGLKGLLLAGMAAALMGHVATVLNSASTIVTLDLYKKLINPNASERTQVLIGRWSGAIILIASVWIAIGFTQQTDTTLFEKMQTVFFFIAPPFAVIFTLGILWKRANSAGAVATIVIGFIWSWALKQFVLLGQYNTFNHRALAAWIVCMAVMIVVSLLTPPPPEEKIKGVIWNKSFLQLPPEEREKYRGLKDWRLWWVIFIAIVLAIYGFFLYYRLQHPW
jgi:SSS family solute:Na+ symporter